MEELEELIKKINQYFAPTEEELEELDKQIDQAEISDDDVILFEKLAHGLYLTQKLVSAIYDLQIQHLVAIEELFKKWGLTGRAIQKFSAIKKFVGLAKLITERGIKMFEEFE